MLSILGAIYQEESLAELFRAKTLNLRLQRRRGPALYTPEQTRRWLCWLARNMRQRDQTVFYVERLQPSWLPTAPTGSLPQVSSAFCSIPLPRRRYTQAPITRKRGRLAWRQPPSLRVRTSSASRTTRQVQCLPGSLPRTRADAD